jgi:hypothetical protein
MSVYFVLVQMACLALIYLFMRLDWRQLLEQRKLRWAGKRGSQYLAPGSQSGSHGTPHQASTGSMRR